MGLNISKIKERNGVNYDCPICRDSKKAPNLVGKFIAINDYQFKCSGCNNLFDKNSIYSLYIKNEQITLESLVKV